MEFLSGGLAGPAGFRSGANRRRWLMPMSMKISACPAWLG